MKELITVQEAAKIIGVTPRTICYHAKNIKVGSKPYGTRILFTSADMKALSRAAGHGRGYFGVGRKRSEKKYA